jgi:glyoxylase-like metal-dependent hydrolase (beta-lactamase superfamily II)
VSVRLNEWVHVVGSGALGLSITHRLDCHVYLIDGGSQAALVDAGVGLGHDRIIAEIESCGVAPERVSTLLLTHAHPDHAAGAPALARALGLRVLAGAETAAAIAQADRHATGLESAQAAGLYPADLQLDPHDVESISHGDRIDVGAVTIEAVATPGHSAGHLAYMLHRPGGRDLFSGDAMLFGGRIILQATHDCEWAAQIDTLHHLAELRHDGLFPGHLGWALRGGDQHARAAVERMARTGLPLLFDG